MPDETATTKRTDGDPESEAAVERPTYGADNALAVNAADLQALLEHARKTGAEALAAKFPNL